MLAGRALNLWYHAIVKCDCDWINPDDLLLTPQGRLWSAERSKAAWEQAYAALRQALSRRSTEGSSGQQQNLYLVCGIQGAGKSTWIKDNAQRLAALVSQTGC